MDIECQATDHARVLARYYRENKPHLEPWEPSRPPGFYAVSQWAKRLHVREMEQAAGRSAYFLGLEPTSGEVIATCSLTNITRGALQACYMGYSVAQRYEGRGLMKQLCLYAIDQAFRERSLNRIMANYMPDNLRSGRLLQNLGFVREGYARNYLHINGRWEDHVLTSLVNPANG